MKLTANQQRVLATLQQANGPLSAYALLDRLRAHGINGPAQVYRALKNLGERGLVHRLETLNAYVTCSHPEERRHGMTIFAICDNCGNVDEFMSDDVGRCLGTWIKNNAFSMSNSTLELRGRCANCSDAAQVGTN